MLKDLHKWSMFSSLAVCNIYRLPSNIEFMDHLLHIHHQSLDTNPWPAKKICGMIYFAALSSVNPKQLKRYGWLSPCCVSAVQKMNTSETGRIYVTPRVCFLRKPALFFPSEQEGPSYWSASLWLHHWLSDRISYVCVCLCVCAHTHAQLMLLVTERCSFRRPSHLLFTVTPVHHKSPWAACVFVSNLITATFQSPTQSRCDNTLPWNLSTGWTREHTIACAHPRACGRSFLSPTKACASVFHGARQPLFDNLFMGWKKKTTCAWWDDRDFMFVEGATE